MFRLLMEKSEKENFPNNNYKNIDLKIDLSAVKNNKKSNKTNKPLHREFDQSNSNASSNKYNQRSYQQQYAHRLYHQQTQQRQNHEEFNQSKSLNRSKMKQSNFYDKKQLNALKSKSKAKKIKQLMKLIQNDKLNAKILKQSPYCSQIYKKQKAINDILEKVYLDKTLNTTFRKSKYTNKNGIISQSNSMNCTTVQYRDTNSSNKLLKRNQFQQIRGPKIVIKIPKQQMKSQKHCLSQRKLDFFARNKRHNEHSKSESNQKNKSKLDKFICHENPLKIKNKITKQSNDQLKIQIQLQKCLLQNKNTLCSEKIKQAVKQIIIKMGLNYNIHKIIGFKVQSTSIIDIKQVKQMQYSQQQSEQQSKSSKHFEDLQTMSYLLSIGKINPQIYKFSSQTKFQLSPILFKVQQTNLKYKNGKAQMYAFNIKDFQMIKCLGSGGFSTVYLARGLFNNKYYAMKLIDKKFILESQRQGIVSSQRFILTELSQNRQASDGARCSFFTQLQFVFETFNHFIFIIQYCPGGQLFNRLKTVKKMNEDQARFYFLEILIGLDYIHSKNVVYRDLKPQNLLIDAEGHIKIADFGLSKPVDNYKSLSYSFCGSPQYMAPEMLTKTGHNYLLDYYCLGALLYQLVVGVPPYYSLNHEQIYQAILTQQLSFPPYVSLSPQLISLLKGLLNKDAKQRLGSLCGIKQIMFHPWIKRVNNIKSIRNRQLKPPYVPDLKQFNFDLADIKTNLTQIQALLDQDNRMKMIRQDQFDETEALKQNQFQTYFSQDFEYFNYKQTLSLHQKVKRINQQQKQIKKQLQIHKNMHSGRFSTPRKYFLQMNSSKRTFKQESKSNPKIIHSKDQNKNHYFSPLNYRSHREKQNMYPVLTNNPASSSTRYKDKIQRNAILELNRSKDMKSSSTRRADRMKKVNSTNIIKTAINNHKYSSTKIKVEKNRYDNLSSFKNKMNEPIGLRRVKVQNLR